MDIIRQTPKRYYEMLSQYQNAQLLFSAIRLDLFSYMDQWTSVSELAQKTGYNEENLNLFLLAMNTIGLIQRNENNYCNMPEGAKFLSKSSPYYLGETLLFREQMTSLSGIDEKIICAKTTGTSQYDFAQLARVAVPEMYATGRVASFLCEMECLYPNKDLKINLLDLGGGSGVLAIEFVKKYPQSKAVVFETPAVASVSKEILKKYGVQEKVGVMGGDFNRDSIGGPYDLIIASGILYFATENLPGFMQKISNSLASAGYLLLIGQPAEDTTCVARNTVSWLSGYLNGLPSAPTKKDVDTAIKNAGLFFVKTVNSGIFEGQLFEKRQEK